MLFKNQILTKSNAPIIIIDNVKTYTAKLAKKIATLIECRANNLPPYLHKIAPVKQVLNQIKLGFETSKLTDSFKFDFKI